MRGKGLVADLLGGQKMGDESPNGNSEGESDDQQISG